jgi:hypothetical protein
MNAHQQAARVRRMHAGNLFWVQIGKMQYLLNRNIKFKSVCVMMLKNVLKKTRSMKTIFDRGKTNYLIATWL